MVSVRYLNWWSGFDPVNSFIPQLLGLSLGDTQLQIVTDPSALVDVEVHSVMTRTRLRDRLNEFASRAFRMRGSEVALQRLSYGIGTRGPARSHVWYSGENLRPPVGWTATLSFDLDDYGGSNWYLPFWAIGVGDLGRHDPSDEFSIRQADLTVPRPLPDRIPPGFACLLARNAHPLRSRVAEALGQLGQVDLFGAGFGGGQVSSKQLLFERYRFAIVLENDLYPGYVTEKAPQAWLSGTIPLWWGSDPSGYLNQDALVNLASSDLSTFVEQVDHLNRDEQAWAAMRSQPILTRAYDYDALIEWLASRLLVGR